MQPLFSWVFYLPLAVLGLPMPHMLRHLSLNTVFQFWVHTEAVVPYHTIKHSILR